LGVFFEVLLRTPDGYIVWIEIAAESRECDWHVIANGRRGGDLHVDLVNSREAVASTDNTTCAGTPPMETTRATIEL
jgi:hypothetical protein